MSSSSSQGPVASDANVATPAPVPIEEKKLTWDQVQQWLRSNYRYLQTPTADDVDETDTVLSTNVPPLSLTAF